MKFLVNWLLISIFIVGGSAYGADFSLLSSAKVSLLNKSTGRYEEKILSVDHPYLFDSRLNLVLRACYKSSSQDEPENIGFFQITKIITDEQYDKSVSLNSTLGIPNDIQLKLQGVESLRFIFSGWLFSSSVSINPVTDQVYDVNIIRCIQ